jgi:hypothetical protein
MTTDLKLDAELKAASRDCLVAAVKHGNAKITKAKILAEIRGFLARDAASWIHQACRAHLRESGFHA